MPRVNFNKNVYNSNKDLSTWEWEDVSNWLHNNQMLQYVDIFQKFAINGYDLCYLTNDDLNEMRLTNFHDRNMILKNIRLMTLEQLKIQINYEEKVLNIQLDFDPNFSTEMLINSLMDLFKIQGNIIHISTNDNEILMPNIKLIDLILLNPKKYKNLKIISSIEDFILQVENEKNYAIKRYENKDNDYYVNKENENAMTKQQNKPNLESYNPTYKNETREKEKETTNDDISTVTNKYKDYNNYNYIPQSKTSEHDNLVLSSKNPLDDYSYNKEPAYNDYNNDNANYSYKANKNNTSNSTPNLINTYETTPSNVNKYSSNTFKYSNENSEDASKLNKNKIPSYDKSYLDEKDSTKGASNFISITENYDKNANSNTNLNKMFKTSEENKMTGTTIKDKDENKNINSSGTPIQRTAEVISKYNYSERFKEDPNKQRFSSEKRSYRVPNSSSNYDNNIESKVDDFPSLIKNEFKYQKFGDKYTENLISRFGKEGSDATSEVNSKDNKNIDTNSTDIKSKVNSIRSQLNSFNSNSTMIIPNTNISGIKKGDNMYKFASSSKTNFNQMVEIESDNSNKKLTRNNSANYNNFKF